MTKPFPIAILKPDPPLGAWEKRVPLVEPKNGSCNDETTDETTGAKDEILKS